MRSVNRVLTLRCLVLVFLCASFSSVARAEEKVVPQRPHFILNGAPVALTVQDLSGFGTRPLRLLVDRNNQARGEALIQVYALGAHEGDDLRMEWAVPTSGTRATLYRVLHDAKGGRFLSMPVSDYFKQPGEAKYREMVEPFREEFFILVFEKTGSPFTRNLNVRFFDEPGRKLSMAAYETNMLFSSLTFKMKDSTGKFIERDAQFLVDRFTRLQRIFLVRIWKATRS